MTKAPGGITLHNSLGYTSLKAMAPFDIDMKEMECLNCEETTEAVKVFGAPKCLECGHINWTEQPAHYWDGATTHL